ncbi:S-adenosyl-L-methionine-dependent methyltransferase [Phyllosticta citrichinensis]|uniref:S-adenosyl-L-methionine-dependent methyltransferase n=1 Tax=Phyllosticta citrichinensis TaxID=1130410 RepID=A0ABR1Y4Y9_9PEZI
MATFTKDSYAHGTYAALRPAYPDHLYDKVINYHQGPRTTALDLGCGPGIVTRAVASTFLTVTGVDPSPGMISQAEQLTPRDSFPNVRYQHGAAEELNFALDGSVDAVVSGEAAHWFDYGRLWPELHRVLRREGTVAFWGYADPEVVDYPRATAILKRWTFSDDKDALGPYLSQPGKRIVEGLYRDIVPDPRYFGDVQRVEYEPGTSGPRSGKGEVVLSRTATVEEWKEYMRTWSGCHAWQEAHPEQSKRSAGGPGDVMDAIYDEMTEAEEWKADQQMELELEWGTGVVMARRV